MHINSSFRQPTPKECRQHNSETHHKIYRLYGSVKLSTKFWTAKETQWTEVVGRREREREEGTGVVENSMEMEIAIGSKRYAQKRRVRWFGKNNESVSSSP